MSNAETPGGLFSLAIENAWGRPHLIGLGVALVGLVLALLDIGNPFTLVAIFTFLGGVVAGGLVNQQPTAWLIPPGDDDKSIARTRLVHGYLVGGVAGGIAAGLLIVLALFTAATGGFQSVSGDVALIQAARGPLFTAVLFGVIAAIMIFVQALIAGLIGSAVGTTQAVRSVFADQRG